MWTIVFRRQPDLPHRELSSQDRTRQRTRRAQTAAAVRGKQVKTVGIRDSKDAVLFLGPLLRIPHTSGSVYLPREVVSSYPANTFRRKLLRRLRYKRLPSESPSHLSLRHRPKRDLRRSRPRQRRARPSHSA